MLDCVTAGLRAPGVHRRSGSEKRPEHWRDPANRCFGLLLDGAAEPDRGADGGPQADDLLLLLANAGEDPVAFAPPAVGAATAWETLLDTAAEPPSPARHPAGRPLTLPGRSLRLLRGLAATPAQAQGRRAGRSQSEPSSASPSSSKAS